MLLLKNLLNLVALVVMLPAIQLIILFWPMVFVGNVEGDSPIYSPVLNNPVGCRLPFFDSGTPYVGCPGFAIRAFCTWKCEEDCKMTAFHQIKCSNSTIIASTDNPNQIPVSCHCDGLIQKREKCQTHMYTWSDVIAAHREFCSSAPPTTTIELTTMKETTTTTSAINPIATSASSESTSTSVAIKCPCPARTQPYLDITSGCRTPFNDPGIRFAGICRPIFAAIAFFTWKCKEECKLSHVENITCPKSLSVRFDDKMSCVCAGEPLAEKCATRLYSWSEVEAAHYEFCSSAYTTTTNSTVATKSTAEISTAGPTTLTVNPISTSASTQTISPTSSTVTYCPENLQPYLDVSSGCRKPFQNIGILFVGKCGPIFAVMAFFTWKCKVDCEVSHIDSIKCSKPMNTRFDGKMFCNCTGQPMIGRQGDSDISREGSICHTEMCPCTTR